MDPGKERFLRNFNKIRRFAVIGDLPSENLWDFMNAIADLFYNFRREKVVRGVKQYSPTFKRFMRKNLSNKKRQNIFSTIKHTIRKVVIHLLNEKVLWTK